MPVVALVLFAFCDKKCNFSKLIVSQPQLCGNWSPHQATQFRWWIVKKSRWFFEWCFSLLGSLVNLHRVVCLMWSMIFEMTDDSWMQISEAFQLGAISVRITPHRHSSTYYQSKNLMIVDEGNIFLGICCHYFWCLFAAVGATFRGRGAWMLQTYWPLLVSTHRPVFKQATLFKHLPKNKT